MVRITGVLALCAPVCLQALVIVYLDGIGFFKIVDGEGYVRKIADFDVIPGDNGYFDDGFNHGTTVLAEDKQCFTLKGAIVWNLPTFPGWRTVLLIASHTAERDHLL